MVINYTEPSGSVYQFVHASACVCRDIEHAESLNGTKEA